MLELKVLELKACPFVPGEEQVPVSLVEEDRGEECELELNSSLTVGAHGSFVILFSPTVVVTGAIDSWLTGSEFETLGETMVVGSRLGRFSPKEVASLNTKSITLPCNTLST